MPRRIVDSVPARKSARPVTYKASYTGLLKHLFDLMDMHALRDRPVTLCATGRAPTHGHLVEGGLRALFAFFEARVTPGFVYGWTRTSRLGGGRVAHYQVTLKLGFTLEEA